jgi:hypothetical protein
MHRAIFVLWNTVFYMVLSYFITPQFESGAPSEVTVLRRDSPSSCVTTHSRSSESLQADRWTQSKIIKPWRKKKKTKMRERERDKNPETRLPATSLPRVPFVCLCGCTPPTPLSTVLCVATRPHPGIPCGLQPAAPGRGLAHCISQVGGTPSPNPTTQKEWANSAIIIGHYFNKGVSLFKLLHENCTFSKSHEPEKW